jgi:hypothetical protein
MTTSASPGATRIASRCVVLAAMLVAVIGSRDWAGGWNDSSRLATVESLVDEGTLAIDHAVYVTADEAAQPGPGRPPIRTRDKLLIAGHYYSDKSPVPALLMAGPYQLWKWVTGSSARDDLPSFVWWMTLVSSGLAYVVAVWCIFRLALLLELSLRDALLLTASFGLATVSPVYARHVNNHILLLGVSAAMLLCLAHLSRTDWQSVLPLLFGVGSLAGLGYAIDLGAGPPLLFCTLLLVAYRSRSWSAVLVAGAGAAPWLVLNHAVNYATGGTFKPANAVPEYLAWPGSPFDTHNMTGALNHASIGYFLLYALDLLVGQRGFLGHSLPLFLAVAALPRLLWRRPAEAPELVFAAAWSAGTWLLYSFTSTNHSGLCCSVRWFVPLLAPGYFVLALCLREFPRYRGDFLLLSGGGALLTAHLWYRGPWVEAWLALYWPVMAVVLLAWLGYRVYEWRRNRGWQQSEDAALMSAARRAA